MSLGATDAGKKKSDVVIMNQTLIDGQEDKPLDWGTSVGAVQDQTSRTKVMNILTDSRACRWWSGTHEVSRSAILRVLLGDLNVVHAWSSSFRLHLRGYIGSSHKVHHQDVPNVGNDLVRTGSHPRRSLN